LDSKVQVKEDIAKTK